jgi:lantibiotic modifying enzyme
MAYTGAGQYFVCASKTYFMRTLVKKQLDKVNDIINAAICRNDSFLSGRAGMAYYYFHLYKVTEVPGFREKGEALLERVFDNLDARHPQLVGNSLSNGGAGLAYMMNALGSEGLLAFDPAEFAELDKFLFDMAFTQIEEDFIDYLHGATGVIHYFTSRDPGGIPGYYNDALIYKLCNNAVRKEEGSWFRNYTIRTDDKQKINFGLSHGLCGILLILLNAYDRSGHKELIKTTVEEGIRFIRKYKMDIDFFNDEYSFFPFIVPEGADEITAPNRLGWCYGDLNEVLLFYRAGRLLDDPQLIDLADLIGAQTLMRKDARSTLVEGSCLCHGSSGLAQFYKTLYAERPLPEYKIGYEYWIEQTLLLLDKDLDSNTYFGKEHELLNGLVGVAFPLLSYISDVELRWSKAFLL